METEAIQPTIEAIVKGLTPLAQQLQVPAEKLFEWAIKYNYSQGITDSILIFSVIIGAYFFVQFFKWGEKKARPDTSSTNFDEHEYLYTLSVIWGVIEVLGFVICFFSLSNIVARFVSPEFMALKDLISLIVK